jgi:ABC-type multidrug transport system ATPase subunit
MQKQFKGEAIFSAETDVHFPQLTVGDTLTFAAMARTPRTRFPNLTRKRYAEHLRDVVMAMLGLRHTFNTKVGNDFVRGVSGGERKRVSIAEAILSGAPLQCWDNSTRGLDSANALEFCKNLRLMSDYAGITACVAIYQASQSAYDVSWTCRYCLLRSPLTFINHDRSLIRSLFCTKANKSTSARLPRLVISLPPWALTARRARPLPTSSLL